MDSERLEAGRIRAYVLRSFGWARSAVLVLALAGCATLTKDSSPEVKREAVTERVNARWAALINEDLDTAYTFLSPASKSLTTRAAYKASARGKGFRSAKIESVDCESETCRVKLMIVYDHPKMQGIPTPLEETWVIDEGQVWYVWR